MKPKKASDGCLTTSRKSGFEINPPNTPWSYPNLDTVSINSFGGLAEDFTNRKKALRQFTVIAH
jgi:hypothetical protein